MNIKSMKGALRRGIRRLGYSVYRSQSLPIGLDLIADVSRIRDFASMRVIVDVGANVGDWTRQYLAHAPHATFFCFEPASATFGVLQRRMTGIDRVQTVRAAIGGQPGPATMYHQRASVQNTLIAPTGSNAATGTETVQVITLDAFTDALDIGDIDLLKTDTEGFDEQVLLGATALLQQKRVGFVLAEVNFATEDRNHSDFDEITATLKRFQYQPIGFYDLHLSGPPWFVTYLNVLYTCL